MFYLANIHLEGKENKACTYQTLGASLSSYSQTVFLFSVQIFSQLGATSILCNKSKTLQSRQIKILLTMLRVR